MVTRKDIAQKAGVSVSVVSRALNNSGYVDAEKKKKILKIAQELGFYPNPVAMSLMSRHTKQVLFYCRGMKDAFNIEMYEGMLDAADRRGYLVYVCGKLDFNSIRNTMVDGLILPNEDAAQQYLKDIGKNYYLPVVAASRGELYSFAKSIPVVECNLWEGTRTALQYLWDRGHCKIAMVSPYNINFRDARIIAWLEFMKSELGGQMKQYFFGIDKEGLAGDKRILKFPEEKYEESSCIQDSCFEKGMLAAQIFAERKSDATAVIGFNDEIILGFYKGLTQLGYQIPKDVSLVGINGVHSRKYADLSITSLGLNPRMMGEKCVELLIDIINGKKAKYVTHVPVNILEGESVRDLRH